MNQVNHGTRQRFSAGHVFVAGFGALALMIAGCGGGIGGIGGLGSNCAALATEAGEIAAEGLAGAFNDPDFQCRLLRNQVATLDAGCFDLAAGFSGGLTGSELDAFRDTIAEQLAAQDCQ